MYVIFAECRYFAAMLLLLRCTIFRHRKQLTKKEPLLSSTSSICVCNFTKNCSVLILKIQRSRFQYLWNYLLLYSKEDRPGDEMLQINSINTTCFLIVHFKNIIQELYAYIKEGITFNNCRCESSKALPGGHLSVEKTPVRRTFLILVILKFTILVWVVNPSINFDHQNIIY